MTATEHALILQNETAGLKAQIEQLRQRAEQAELRAGELYAELRKLKKDAHSTGCISYASGMGVHHSVIYLEDGTKISVGRGDDVKGAVWLEVGQSAQVHPANHSKPGK